MWLFCTENWKRAGEIYFIGAEKMEAEMTEKYIIETEHLTKSFYGVTVLHDINFRIKQGEVHAIVGENGAGKSTLIKVLTGIYQKDGGSIKVDGKEVEVQNAREGRNLSISCIHQELCLVDDLTIAQNIYLGLEFSKYKVFLNDRKIRDEAQKLLDDMGLHLRANEKVRGLTVAQKQMVEICRALVLNANVIIMDEPSASLTDREVKALFVQIERLKKQNKAIIYISHRLEEVMQIADKVSVLRDGHLIETRSTSDVTKSEMVRMMVGREIGNLYGVEKKKRNVSEEIVFEVKHLANKNLKDISFFLKKGEILGVAGLVGAGRTEMARAIFGIDRLEQGEIYIGGEKVRIHNPREAMKYKIALVPEDRKKQGLILTKSVAYNLTLTVLKKFIKGIFRNKENEEKIIQEYANKLSIKMTGVNQICNTLSGGNQQKVVVSKWLATGADIIIFDEPTRGIDVGAKAEIYTLMYALASEGKSIIMISSEMPEVINVSDRIAVMCEGKLEAVLEKNDYEENELSTVIGQYAMGGIQT